MEKLYLDLNPEKESVHFESFPKSNLSTQKDLMIIESMNYAQKYSSLILSLRKKNNIRVRQPLQKVMIPVNSKNQSELIEKVTDLIKSETNIKDIVFISSDSDFLKKKIKADFKKLGPKYGKLMKSIAEKIQQLNQEEIVTLERNGTYDVKIGEENITISVEDVEIAVEDVPGWLVATENNLTVALDITLTEELKQEGVARDIVNRLQNLRKDRDYELTDRILVKIKPVQGLNEAVQSNFNYICTEILAEKLELTEVIEESKAVEIELEDNLKTLVEISLA
jgi:isoleucyl-tRNA synthetase